MHYIFLGVIFIRYNRNKPLINETEQNLLSSCVVAVVGLGGLGGTIAEELARLGFGKLILIDGDQVDVTNLNRQIFATEPTVGKFKGNSALQRLQSINSTIDYEVHNIFLDKNNGESLLQGANIVIDALDNITSRRILKNACKNLNLPIIHGAIGGWYGHISFITPEDKTLEYLYPSHVDDVEPLGNPSFTAYLVGSIQVAQAVSWRLGKGNLLINKVLYIDLLTQDFQIVDVVW